MHGKAAVVATATVTTEAADETTRRSRTTTTKTVSPVFSFHMRSALIPAAHPTNKYAQI